jgi:hypothetical protein
VVEPVEESLVWKNPDSAISPAHNNRNPARIRMKTVLKLIFPFTHGVGTAHDLSYKMGGRREAEGFGL